MKYLTEERFIVNSNDKQSLKNYRDNYDRIFGKKDEDPAAAPQDTDAIEMRFVAITHFCKACQALVPDPENHQHHALVQGVADLALCAGCDEEHCECDEHDPACSKLCTRDSVCDCGRFTRL